MIVCEVVRGDSIENLPRTHQFLGRFIRCNLLDPVTKTIDKHVRETPVVLWISTQSAWCSASSSPRQWSRRVTARPEGTAGNERGRREPEGIRHSLFTIMRRHGSAS